MWEQRFCGHGDFRDNELLLKNSIYPHCTARPSSSRVRESQLIVARCLPETLVALFPSHVSRLRALVTYVRKVRTRAHYALTMTRRI